MVQDLALRSELNPDDRELPVKVQREAVKFVNWLVAHGVDRTAAVDGVQKFLLAVVVKKKSAKATIPVKRPEAQAIVARYGALYKVLYGELPQVSGTDWVHVTTLLRDYSAPVVTSRLEALAKYVREDAWMKTKFGFSLGVLRNQWTRVTVYAKQHEPPPAAATQPDSRGHFPPCKSFKECNERYFREQQS